MDPVFNWFFSLLSSCPVWLVRDLSVDTGLPPHQYHVRPLPQHFQHYLTSPRMHHFPRNSTTTQVVRTSQLYLSWNLNDPNGQSHLKWHFMISTAGVHIGWTTWSVWFGIHTIDHWIDRIQGWQAGSRMKCKDVFSEMSWRRMYPDYSFTISLYVLSRLSMRSETTRILSYTCWPCRASTPPATHPLWERAMRYCYPSHTANSSQPCHTLTPTHTHTHTLW